MKKSSFFLITIFISATVLLSSFTNLENNTFNPPNEFKTLLNYLENNVNYIENELPLIMADEVKKNYKNSKYHIIDIRANSWFDYGHIKNAANVKAENLLTYFENTIKPSDFDKIVMVCYSGQSASYYASLLRLAGYKVPTSTADPDLFKTFAKSELVAANGQIEIAAQDAEGNDIENWSKVKLVS